MRHDVIIYGDSLMKGTVIDERMRYHATMDERIGLLERRFPLRVTNKARFGSTIGKGQALLEKDLQQGIQAGYALIEFGGNDCNFDWTAVSRAPEEDHQPLTPLPRFNEGLLAMLTALKQQGIKPVLMTLPPIHAERYLNFISRNGNDKGRILQWLGDAQLIYRFQELYSDTIAKVAEKTNTLLVDVRSRFLARRDFDTLLGLDGIHLAPGGYEEVYIAFDAYLDDSVLGPAAV